MATLCEDKVLEFTLGAFLHCELGSPTLLILGGQLANLPETLSLATSALQSYHTRKVFKRKVSVPGRSAYTS